MDHLEASRRAGISEPKNTSPFHDIFDSQFGMHTSTHEQTDVLPTASAPAASRTGTADELRLRKHGNLRGYRPPNATPTADAQQALLVPETQSLEPNNETHMRIASDENDDDYNSEHEDLEEVLTDMLSLPVDNRMRTL